MGTDEQYERGQSCGWGAANFAVAYEGATPSDDPCEVDPGEYGVTGSVEQGRFLSGFDDGWRRFMSEDYPD